MVKRRTFKRSLKTTVNKVMSKYQRRKMNYVMTISWSNGTLQIDGEQKQSFSIGDVLTGNTSEFQSLGKQYAMVKLRGIYVEALPNYYGSGTNFGIALLQANDEITFNNIKNQPNLMICANNLRSKMYVPISGEFTSTNSIELFTNMKLTPFAQDNPNARFTVRITLYLTFKSTL